MALRRSSLAFCSASSRSVVCSFSRRFSAVHSVFALSRATCMVRARQTFHSENNISVSFSASSYVLGWRVSSDTNPHSSCVSTLSHGAGDASHFPTIPGWAFFTLDVVGAQGSMTTTDEIDRERERDTEVVHAWASAQGSQVRPAGAKGGKTARVRSGWNEKGTNLHTNRLLCCKFTCEALPEPSPWRGFPSLSPPPPPMLDLVRRALSPLPSPLHEPGFIIGSSVVAMTNA